MNRQEMIEYLRNAAELNGPHISEPFNEIINELEIMNDLEAAIEAAWAHLPDEVDWAQKFLEEALLNRNNPGARSE